MKTYHKLSVTKEDGLKAGEKQKTRTGSVLMASIVWCNAEALDEVTIGYGVSKESGRRTFKTSMFALRPGRSGIFL